MNLAKLQRFFDAYDQLREIAKQLHRLDVYFCDYGLTKRQERRAEKLEKEAEEIAKRVFKLHAYHQGDPRGASLYLVKSKKEANAGAYNYGVCIG